MVSVNNSLVLHCKKYPNLGIRDIFKFIYQSALGCEHLVSSQEAATAYIEREYESLTRDGGKAADATEVDLLSLDFGRVPLNYLSVGLSAKTLARLFHQDARRGATTAF